MAGAKTKSSKHSGYAQVGPLKMYWDQQGRGRPLLLLHAGFLTIDTSFGKIRPKLAKQWTTIGIEQQAHGHTPDLDRPLSYEQMVEDTAEFIQQRKLGPVDVFGWSDGGVVALGLATRYPKLVRKVAITGAGFGPDAESPEFKKRMAAMKPDHERFKPFHEVYRRVAPEPAKWPVMIEKVKAMYRGFKGWPKARLRKLKAPLLVMLGDHDFLRIEHATELFRLVPEGRLAVLPGSDHSVPVVRAEWIIPMLTDFFGSRS